MTNIITKFTKTASGNNCYSMDADSVLFFTIATKIQEKFGLDTLRLPIYGLDGTYLDLKKDKIKINLMWDVWTEFSIFCMTDSDEGEKLIREIGEYLDSILNELEVIEEKLLKEYEENKEKSENNN